MNTRENFYYEPLQNVSGYSSEDVIKNAYENAYKGYRNLNISPGTGKIGVLLFPQYFPTNDLIYSRTEDNLETNYIDESIIMTNESWPVINRPPLVNFGGHRVGVVGQELLFDATESQYDEDLLPTSYTWYVNDVQVGTRSIFRYIFNQPGLYKVSCKIQNTEGIRYVRILNEWGESDLDVVSIGSLTGSVEAGWQTSIDVKDTVTNNMLQPYQGIMIYVYDSLDQSWRRQYNANMRAINRRIKSTAELPPDPLWQTTYVGWKEGEESYYVYTEEPKNINVLLQDNWPDVDFYLDTYIQSQSKYGTPVNLGRALAHELTSGNKTYPFGRSRIQATGAEHVRQGMLMIAEYYRDCGRSWKKALKAFISGTCSTSESLDWNSLEGKVYDRWAFLDEVGGVGGSVLAKNLDKKISVEDNLNIPTPAHVLFFGYVDTCTVNETANEITLKLGLVNSTEMLNKTYQRLEAYWESAAYASSGGTVMETPPMRTSTCIHHLLTYHTNFPKYHDVILDWSGPRFWSTTSPEGSTWQAITGWAGNDYAWAFADRYGQMRYMTQPFYKGSQWYGEAIKEAIRIDEKHVIDMQIQELRMLKRTAYSRLCGVARGGNCEICGEFPCGGPQENSPGEWSIKRGLQYDDYRVLCRYAAYNFAYQNRSYDVQATMPWRHDLDLGDLVFFPFNDPQNRFLWNVSAPPVFVIKQIAHQYDNTTARWITTISAEQLTYGVACDCDNQTCPVAEDSGICNGDIGCDLIIDPSLWKEENIVRSLGKKISAGLTERMGALLTVTDTGSQIATIYGEATSLFTENIDSMERVTNNKNPNTSLNPKTYVTETTYKGNTGQESTRTLDMTVPYFTVAAKGPIGGSLKIELKIKAKEKRRAYFHIFYTSQNKPITSETDDYFNGQEVLTINDKASLYDGPDPDANIEILKLPLNMPLIVNGIPSKANNRNIYPVTVDAGNFTSGDKARIKIDNTQVRSQPSLTSAYAGTLSIDTIVVVSGNSVSNNNIVWYPIVSGNIAGWVGKEELKYISGWIDTQNLTSKQKTGEVNPIKNAQSLVPTDLQQIFDAFPSDSNFYYVATIEQYDYKLRDIKNSDYVDTLSIKTLLAAKESSTPYVFGVVVTSEYGKDSWILENPVQEIDAWQNVSIVTETYKDCDCSTLQFSDLPQEAQVRIKVNYNGQEPSSQEWISIRNQWCFVEDGGYVSKNCVATSKVDKKTQSYILQTIDLINKYNEEDIIYIQTTSQRSGAEASIEIVPGCKDCYDPMAISQTSGQYGGGPKPEIYLLAGHASYQDAGDSNERDFNIEMAKAYKEAFLSSGYTVKWWQEVDGDANPTMSPGNHSTVATGVANLMGTSEEERLILLDLHHEMIAGAPGVFVIIPDAEPDDTWDLNNDAVALGKIIAANIHASTNLDLRTIGVREAGLMSEKQTGAAESGGRLATFYYTKGLRDKAIRLIIEHGNLLTSDKSIINTSDFPKKCAAATVKAIDQMYPESSGVFGCENWPSVAAIEAELNRVANNGRKSPMASFSSKFMEWGSKYLINPAFVLALCFSESQYGTDGELSVYANNYGGHTYGNANVTLATCGPYNMGGVQWNKYCTPEEGAEALFKFLDKSIYRTSGGTIKNIIDIYSPVGTGVLGNTASAINEKYEIIKLIGQKLGVTLLPETQIYTESSQCMTENVVPAPNDNYGGYTTMFQWSFIQAGCSISQGPYMGYTHTNCDCYDFAVPNNTQIYSFTEGIVTFAEKTTDQYRPWKIVVDTIYGSIIYAHLNTCNVRKNQKIYFNTLIGLSGECCDSLIGGPHLHLGLSSPKTKSNGSVYRLDDALRAAGIDMSKFGRSY